MPIFTVLIKAEFKSDEVLKFATSEELQYGVLPNVLSTIRIGEQEWDADCTFVSSTSNSSKMVLWGSLTIPITFNTPRNSPDVAKEIGHYVRMLEKSKAFIRGLPGSGTAIEKKPRSADIKVLPPLLETFPVSASMPAEAKVFADYVNENGLWVEDRMELADSTATADWKLGRLAFDPVPQVRALVASNSQTSELTLRLLATNNHRKSTPPEDLVSGENRDWVFYNPASDFKKLADDDFLAPLLQGQDAAISELAEAELARRGLKARQSVPAESPANGAKSEFTSISETSDRFIRERRWVQRNFKVFTEWVELWDVLLFTEDPAVLDLVPRENIWTEGWGDDSGGAWNTADPPRDGLLGYYVCGRPTPNSGEATSYITTIIESTCPDCFVGEWDEDTQDEFEHEEQQERATEHCDTCKRIGIITNSFAETIGLVRCESAADALAEFTTRSLKSKQGNNSEPTRETPAPTASVAFGLIQLDKEEVEEFRRGYTDWVSRFEIKLFTTDPSILDNIPHEHIWTEYWDSGNDFAFVLASADKPVESAQFDLTGYYVAKLPRGLVPDAQADVRTIQGVTCPTCYLGEMDDEDDGFDEHEQRQEDATGACDECYGRGVVDVPLDEGDLVKHFTTSAETLSAFNEMKMTQIDEVPVSRARFCEACGHNFSHSAVFCESCGAKRS